MSDGRKGLSQCWHHLPPSWTTELQLAREFASISRTLFRHNAGCVKSKAAELTASDRIELERLQRSSSAPAGLSRRARAVLLMAGDMTGTEVARLTGYTPIQISRIRRRFAEEGMAGLIDRPRPGRPPRLTEAKRARIVALTLKAPPKGLTHWSTRELGERVGVSHATVHRIWQAHALQPHRVETCCRCGRICRRARRMTIAVTA
jgi:putative transposase